MMMIDIPEQAIVNRIIPKDRFNFKNATQIERIRWVGKLAQATINLKAQEIPEIEVFSIDMPDFSADVIVQILHKIPQEILFIVNDNIAIMRYGKQLITKVIKVPLRIKGLTIDAVRDNFIRQLLGIEDTSQPLIEQVSIINQMKSLELSIESINQKIKHTTQVNKKQILARKRYDLEQQVKRLKENNNG